MKSLKHIITLLFVIMAITVYGQNKSNLHYSIGIPMGDTKDYISKTSWRGLLFEYERLIQPKIGVGIQVGWNTFYEEMPRATYPIENGAITSKQYRYLNSIPLQITGKYYFTDDNSPIRPFIGLGAGTNYLEAKNDNGLFSTRDKSWALALTPKAGALIPINYSTSISVSFDYNTTFKTSDVPQQNWLGINIGFSWDY
nr:OmpW family outer membrane protein [uncultured Carboxylicivirga sp.]